jgi:hypothetical protein
MRTASLLATLLLCTLAHADSPAPAFTPLAGSAQVSVSAARGNDAMTLRLTRATDHSDLPVTQLSATLDGKALPATRGTDGSWALALGAGVAHGTLELTVAHDGIRELLTGTLGAAAAPGATAGGSNELLRDHKQLLWWILNIAIVLIAAIAISRRTS